MPRERCFYPSTTHPPPYDDDDDAQADDSKKLPWVLLEHMLYVAKREIATTAFSSPSDGPEIQVTLCARRPPRVSYLCVHSPRDDVAIEPEIIATEDDLILLRVSMGSQYDLNELEILHYYIYQADDGSGRPSLKYLPRPPCRTSFNARDMGVLRYHHNGYIVAGIVQEVTAADGVFTLYVYDSGQLQQQAGADWKTYTVTSSHQLPLQYTDDDDDGYFFHKTCKVMAIGGPDATMAFVDLWTGILFCDIRKLQQHHYQDAAAAADDAIPILSYVPVPSFLDSARRGDARLWRNIALIGGRLKYVELKRHWKIPSEGWYIPDGWVAATFSRPAAAAADPGSSDCSSWRHDCYMDSNKTDFSNDPCLQLLPKASTYDGMAAPPFKGLHIRQPVLGLQEDDDDIIFFTTKLGSLCDDAWVVAVDMRNKTILGVDAFSASRVIRNNFSYIHSRISRYLRN